jgi:hypothetical protein
MSAGRRRGSRSAPPLEYSLLLTATLCLLALGAVMVFSASSARSLLADGGDGFYYLKRTVLFAGIGLVVMRFASIKGLQVARMLTPALLAISIFLLVAVLLPGVGSTVNGAQRWLGAGLFQFQPAEMAKFAIVLYGAHLLADGPKRVRSLEGLMPYLLVVGLAAILIARQPDLGSAIVLCFAVCCMLFAAGVRPRTLAPVGAVVVIAALAMIATQPYQRERLTGFLNPGRERPEGLLSPRGAHRHDCRRPRRGDRPRGHGRPHRALRDVRLRRLPRRPPGSRSLQQAARGGADLADHGPGGGQPVRGAGARAAHRGAAAVRLLRRHQPRDHTRSRRPDPERGPQAGRRRCPPPLGRRLYPISEGSVARLGRGHCKTSRGRGRNP